MKGPKSTWSLLLTLVTLHQLRSVYGLLVDEVEYVTFRVVSEYEVRNKNNGTEPECRKEYENINRNYYITPDERLEECRNVWGSDLLDNIECYDDDFMDNSCAIKCFARDSDKCDGYVENVRKMRFIDKQCGPQHFCNELGCCEKRATTSSPPTTSGPTTSRTSGLTSGSTSVGPTEKSRTEATTIKEMTETVVNHWTTTTMATRRTTESEEFVCPSFGDFADERDPSSFWHCDYEMVEVFECNQNEKFDTMTEKCDYDWARVIKCDRDGWFRNPYDCHKFYRCYKDRVYFVTCAEDVNGEPMVWDEEKVSCVSNQNDTILCDDRPLPIDTTGEGVPNDSLLETDIEFRVLFENNIQCVTTGQFRNPFDCHKYYRCYYAKNDDFLLDIEFYKCKDGLMVFDEKTGSCVDHTKTALCDNKQIPAMNYDRLQSYDNWANRQT